MTVLLLGGTADARRLADKLHTAGLPVIYSVAGLVRPPKVACEYISGGFTQFGGMLNYVNEHGITQIVDATHPYAVNISRNAALAAEAANIACSRFCRPAWYAEPEDNWVNVEDWTGVVDQLQSYSVPLLSAGQMPEEVLKRVVDGTAQPVLRTAVAPAYVLPEKLTWLKAIGPFSFEEEYTLINQHRIDVVVSKNSGGEATSAKLAVARQLGLPVIMFQRPEKVPVEKVFDNPEDCEQWVVDRYRSSLTRNL